MDNGLPFLIIFGTLIIGLFIRGVFLEKKKRLLLYNKLLMEFGEKRIKNYSHGKSHRNSVLKRFAKDEIIDDITWNDLDMEQVFERIDKTRSAIGEEYLYYLLHMESFSEKGKAFDELAEYFSINEKDRCDTLMALERLGYVKNLSPFDYLDYLTGQKSGLPVKHYILDFLYIPAIALIFFNPLYGAAAVFLVIIINILLYFREKHSLDGIVESLGFLIRLSDEGLKIKGYVKDEYEKEYGEFSSSASLFRFIKKRGGYLAVSGQGNSGSGSIAEVFLTYFNMLFHIDLIQYKLLIGKLSGKKELLTGLLLFFGKLDAAISVADFRKSLGGEYCKPVFLPYDQNDRDKVRIVIEEGNHPLVDNFVKNSVSTSKGILLTGSNASGKSTFLRMVAVNCILAQTIYTACCSKYEAPVFNIFSSIALKDNLAGKESYFMVEIGSVKRIIDADLSKRPVICFIDEVLRGTNTVERISASQAILRYFSQRAVICFAATHDGELAQMLEGEFDNYHFSENVKDGDVLFDYKLQKGRAVSRNAIKLLASYGYPGEIVSSAEKMALY